MTLRVLCALVMLSAGLAGCLAQPTPLAPGAAVEDPAAGLALPALDGYYSAEFREGVGFHTYDEIQGRIDAIAAMRPDLVRTEVLGESRGGRPVRALVIENPEVPGPKPAPFYDGGHHANEVEGIEVTLYFAEFLLLNYETSAYIRDLVDRHETWIVPLVNPDGYVVQTRYNAAGVNLNRNYDLDWCSPAAFNTCLPQPVVDQLMGAGQDPPLEHAGTGPFSEPESRAVRDAVLALGDRVTFYLSHHTDVHCIASPWTAPNPPFPVPPEHEATFQAVFDYVTGHTEYGAGRWFWLTGECMSYSAGGSSMDWAYATARVPSFTFEVGGSEAREGAGIGRPTSFLDDQVHGDLAHWVVASLPVELFFLSNAERLRDWGTDLVPPPLPAPEGA